MDSLTATPNVVSVLAANPGLTFSANDLIGIQRNTLVVVQGCINWLRYESDKELTYISIDGQVYGQSDINNLNEFRARFQEAANFGHRVSFCLWTNTDTMSMLNVFPCGCPCKDRQ